MMAMTTISALPWMFDGGRIGAVGRTRISARLGCCSGAAADAFARVLVGILVINIEMPFREDHAAGFHLVHQREIVGGDHHCGAQAVEFHEEV